MIKICENCYIAYNIKLDECPLCGEPKMNLTVHNTYRNKATNKLIQINLIVGGIVTFIYIEAGEAAGEFEEDVNDFKHNYVYSTEVDDRKECFACKELIDPIHQLEFKGAYYHDRCLMNGNPAAQDMNHNDLAGIEQQGGYAEDFHKLSADEIEVLILKPGKIKLVDSNEKQLSERWDNVRLTKYFPTDNLHNKRTINNPTGSKES